MHSPDSRVTPLKFYVLSSVPDYLRGYWTQEHESLRWEGATDGDVWLQETHLWRVIMGYATKTTRAIATYQYQAPHGVNHGLSDMHDEVMEYQSLTISADIGPKSTKVSDRRVPLTETFDYRRLTSEEWLWDMPPKPPEPSPPTSIKPRME